MNESSEVLALTRQHIRELLKGEGSGHDWFHVLRVTTMALRLAAEEGADLATVELAALLHDIADWKFNDGDEEAGPKAARAWLEQQGAEEELIAHVCQIIRTMSFKGAGTTSQMNSIEGKVVQDADRLDALGAIGIGRAFAYGGHIGREMFDPEVAPVLHASAEEYKKSVGTTVNHFYEKLFLLKDRMNTEAAKRLAEGRHAYMEEFIKRFSSEWKGEQ